MVPVNSRRPQGRGRRRQTDSLGGEQRVAVDQRLLAAFAKRRQQRRDPSLIVQVAGADAALDELRQRIRRPSSHHQDTGSRCQRDWRYGR